MALDNISNKPSYWGKFKTQQNGRDSLSSCVHSTWLQSLFRRMVWHAVRVNLLTQQTLAEQRRMEWWVRRGAGSWGAPGWWWGNSACPLLWVRGWVTAPAAAPLGLPLPLCWAHTFGGLLPALWGYCGWLWGARHLQQWLWLLGCSGTLAGFFLELLCDRRCFCLRFLPPPSSFTGVRPASISKIPSRLP